MGDRIRHVVSLFDRKKDAAEIAGVIPEQLNRWCQAQSEPRFVGVSRMALIKGVCLNWIATGKGTPKLSELPESCVAGSSSPSRDTINRDMLVAVISGFLTAEGIDNAAQTAHDIITTYEDIIEKAEKNRRPSDYGYILSEAISTIISRHRRRTAATTPNTRP